MQVIAEHLGGKKFEVAARGHRILCDQPPENNGSDSGMTPPELLLASLATCVGYYAAEYLTTRQLPAQGLKVKVTAEKASHPARLASFRVEISTPELEEHHRTGILRAVKSCLVHNTLLTAPAIELELTTDLIVSA